MGLLDFLHATAGSLAPVSPPIGVHARMLAKERTSLVLQERMMSISGDDFSITNAETGQAVLKCSGSVFSMHDRKKIKAPDGSLLFNIATKLADGDEVFYMFAADATGTEVLKVWTKKSLGSKLEANVRLFDGRWADLVLSGDFWGGSANITLKNGPALAHISRQVANVGEALRDQQTGVDMALMAALCICYDEFENENKNKGKDND